MYVASLSFKVAYEHAVFGCLLASVWVSFSLPIMAMAVDCLACFNVLLVFKANLLSVLVLQFSFNIVPLQLAGGALRVHASGCMGMR